MTVGEVNRTNSRRNQKYLQAVLFGSFHIRRQNKRPQIVGAELFKFHSTKPIGPQMIEVHSRSESSEHLIPIRCRSLLS